LRFTLLKNIYQLIVRQYLAQFYPPYLYQKTQVEHDIAQGKFTVNAKVQQQIDWKIMFHCEQGLIAER